MLTKSVILGLFTLSVYANSNRIDDTVNGVLGRLKRQVAKPAKSKSELMCEKYAESVFELEDSPLLIEQDKIKVDTCAVSAETLIVGGDEAKPSEFPHMALIGFGANKEAAVWLCGGSLISERFVLSAAHCDNYEGDFAKWVLLGDLIINENNDEAEPITIEIIQRIIHPNYNKDRAYNDIELFKLKDKVTFNRFIRPICLNTKTAIAEKRAIASGWGHTQYKGQPSKHLMKVTLNLTKTEDCAKIIKKGGGKLPQGVNGASMLCAGNVAGKDSCQGDSGGPLQVILKNPYCMYNQIGIVSTGPPCGAGYPAVYTRVSNFVPWIEKNVWP